MKLQINDNREISILQGYAGTQNENLATTLEFVVPQEYEDVPRVIYFFEEDETPIGKEGFIGNTYKLKNKVTKHEKVYFCVRFIKDDEEYITALKLLKFNKNLDTEKEITEEDVDFMKTIIKILEEEIQKVKDLQQNVQILINQIDNLDVDIIKENKKTTITVTKKDGATKEIEILDGENYILTEQDKQNIANETSEILQPQLKELHEEVSQLDRDMTNIDNRLTGLNEELQEQEETLNHLGDIKADKSDYVELDKFNTLAEKVADIELFKFPNVIIHGTPTINNGQVSNFSTENYLTFPAVFNLHDRGFEFNFAFRTGSDVTTAQNILGSNFCIALFIQNSKIRLRVSSNGTGWDLVDIEGNIDIQANATYYIKIYFDKLTYKLKYSLDGIDYIDIASKVASVSPFAKQIYLGIGNNFHNPFKGIINLNKCNLKVNKSIVWQGMDDAGLATRLATDLENIDEAGIQKIKDIAKEYVDTLDGNEVAY